MTKYTNIAAYHFAELTDVKSLKAELAGLCRTWNLKGTILLSDEGINLFVAGPAESIELLLERPSHGPGLECCTPSQRERSSAVQPHAGEDQEGDHRLRRARDSTGSRTSPKLPRRSSSTGSTRAGPSRCSTPATITR